jgi:hypothetical protein
MPDTAEIPMVAHHVWGTNPVNPLGASRCIRCGETTTSVAGHVNGPCRGTEAARVPTIEVPVPLLKVLQVAAGVAYCSAPLGSDAERTMKDAFDTAGDLLAAH